MHELDQSHKKCQLHRLCSLPDLAMLSAQHILDQIIRPDAYDRCRCLYALHPTGAID